MSHTLASITRARTPHPVGLATARMRARDVVLPTGSTERALLGVAAAFTVVGVAHVVPFLMDGGVWDGAVSWRKPIVFGVSIGIVTWWLAWVLGTLSWSRRAKTVWATVYAGAFVVEYAVLTAQRWRGVASHFNGTTPLDGALFGLMGMAIAVVSVLVVVLTVAAVWRGPDDPATRWAVIGGLVLMLGGLALGGLVISLGNAQTIDGAAPETVRAGAAGAPKYAHAVALHVSQMLVGLLALTQIAGLPATARRVALRRGVVTCAALVMATSAHTLAGRALFDVANPTGLFLLAALGACAWPFVDAMMAAWRTTDGATPVLDPR
jgi:hypothetical protein